MSKDQTTFPVMKGGKYLGRATAEQIAKNKSLSLYDPAKAEQINAEAAVEEAVKVEDAKASKIEDAKGAGGADAAAVKKGPAK